MLPETIKSRLIERFSTRNNFAIKKLLTSDDLTSDYLIYNSITYEKPQDNWLLDIELFNGEPFLADLVSMQMEELTIEPNLKKICRCLQING